MTDHNDARERVARVIHGAEIAYGHDDLEPFDELRESTRGLAMAYGDAVISHLWRRADDPAVVEAVLLEYANRTGDILMARAAITSTLTALLGPRPEGDTDER